MERSLVLLELYLPTKVARDPPACNTCYSTTEVRMVKVVKLLGLSTNGKDRHVCWLVNGKGRQKYLLYIGL